jgi:hypothetical protein
MNPQIAQTDCTPDSPDHLATTTHENYELRMTNGENYELRMTNGGTRSRYEGGGTRDEVRPLSPATPLTTHNSRVNYELRMTNDEWRDEVRPLSPATPLTTHHSQTVGSRAAAFPFVRCEFNE